MYTYQHVFDIFEWYTQHWWCTHTSLLALKADCFHCLVTICMFTVCCCMCVTCIVGWLQDTSHIALISRSSILPVPLCFVSLGLLCLLTSFNKDQSYFTAYWWVKDSEVYKVRQLLFPSPQIILLKNVYLPNKFANKCLHLVHIVHDIVIAFQTSF